MTIDEIIAALSALPPELRQRQAYFYSPFLDAHLAVVSVSLPNDDKVLSTDHPVLIVELRES
jgi:hypothetical protein